MRYLATSFRLSLKEKAHENLSPAYGAGRHHHAIAHRLYRAGQAPIGRDMAILYIALMVLGFATILLAARSFRKHETTIIPDGQPSTLMEGGLFAYSRNPIYVAMAVPLSVRALPSDIFGL